MRSWKRLISMALAGILTVGCVAGCGTAANTAAQPARLDQPLHRIRPVDRHHRAARLVVRRMQRDRQRDLQLFLRQTVDLIRQSGGGQRDVALSDVQPVGRADQFQKPQHIVVVVQRFAGSHQYNVGDPLPRVLLHEQNLV